MARVWLALAATVLGLGLLLAGAPSRAQGYLPGIQEIVDRGKLTIAVVGTELPPMIGRSAEGELGGFDIALGKDIARELGVEASFVTAGPSQTDVIDLVAKGGADLGLSYLRLSPKAGRRVYFTQPYMIESDTLLINRVKGIEFNQECPGLSDLRRLLTQPGAVGMVAGSFYESAVEAFEPKAAPRKFEGVSEMMRAVTNGDVTVSVQGEVAAKYLIARTQEAAIKLKLCEVPGEKTKVAAAVRPGSLDLLRWLNLYILDRGIIIETDTLIYREDRRLE